MNPLKQNQTPGRLQASHPGRMEHSHNILQQQQHTAGVHGNQGLGDAERNSATQNSRLQSEGSFGLGVPGAPGGEGADHALDVSGRFMVQFKGSQGF